MEKISPSKAMRMIPVHTGETSAWFAREKIYRNDPRAHGGDAYK